MIDYKGFTEEEVQEMINWKATMRGYDEIMWKMYARSIIMETIKKASEEKVE